MATTKKNRGARGARGTPPGCDCPGTTLVPNFHHPSTDLVLPWHCRYNNNMGDDIGEKLALLMHSNKTLKSLDLRNALIGERTAMFLTNALHENKVLTTLELAGNNIRCTFGSMLPCGWGSGGILRN